MTSSAEQKPAGRSDQDKRLEPESAQKTPDRARIAKSPGDLENELGAICAWLEAHKAEAVMGIDLHGQNSFAEALVLASASSMRQAQALADGLMQFIEEHALPFQGIEGYAAAQWILLDLGHIVINIFLESTRQLYRLEALWGGMAQESQP